MESSSKLRLSGRAEGALRKIAAGDAVGGRWLVYLMQRGLVQRDMFTSKCTLTADGRAQLGADDGKA